MQPSDAAIRYACPVDKAPLTAAAGTLACAACGRVYPVVRGVPVLLNDENSVFRTADYTAGTEYEGASGYGGNTDTVGGLRGAYRRWAHRLSETGIGLPHFGQEQAVERIFAENPQARVLVIGAGDRGYDGDVTYTDVAFGARVTCICDAHDLPFPDGRFDAVLASSVLEHVVDPQRCVTEIERVLRPGGYVYALTPFLQPVHMKAYDFTRFTYLGHRRLFRRFDDLESGICGGPANSLAYVLRYTLLSVTDNHTARTALRLAGLLLSVPIRYADYYFVRRMAAYDAAFAVFFFGTKRETAIPDRELIALYRGGS